MDTHDGGGVTAEENLSPPPSSFEPIKYEMLGVNWSVRPALAWDLAPHIPVLRKAGNAMDRCSSFFRLQQRILHKAAVERGEDVEELKPDPVSDEVPEGSEQEALQAMADALGDTLLTYDVTAGEYRALAAMFCDHADVDLDRFGRIAQSRGLTIIVRWWQKQNLTSLQGKF